MGAKGWHSRGYLPHYDGHGISQHAVFRLYDSVPPGQQSGDDILDRHLGSAFLRNPTCARHVVEALLHHDEERYLLQAWCVMPNHAHVLLAVNQEFQIGGIVRSWKMFSTRKINQELGRSGPVWAADYFDRYIRDEAHFDSTKRYIEMNPVAAGLCDRPEDWPFGSAGWKR